MEHRDNTWMHPSMQISRDQQAIIIVFDTRVRGGAWERFVLRNSFLCFIDVDFYLTFIQSFFRKITKHFFIQTFIEHYARFIFRPGFCSRVLKIYAHEYSALRPLLDDVEQTENFKIDHFDEKNRPFLHIFVSARSRSWHLSEAEGSRKEATLQVS